MSSSARLSISTVMFALATVLSGCAAQNTRETHVRYPDDSYPASSRYPTTTSNRAPSGSYDTTMANRPRTTASTTPKPANTAVSNLVGQAQNQMGQGNYQGAIATAERGLRIDRRSPDLYLVLAKSYLKLGQPDQAAQFANQGLRYSISGSREARALEDTRRQALQ